MFFKRTKKKEENQKNNFTSEAFEPSFSQLESSSETNFSPFQSFTSSRAYSKTMSFREDANFRAKHSKTSREDIENAMIANHNAVLKKQQGQLEEALEEYTKAITFYPEYSSAYFNRALLYLQNKDYTNALADYTRSLKYNDHDPETYNNRANIYVLLDKPNKAIEDYTSAIEFFPNYSEAYHNRAQIYLKQGKTSEAIEDFKIVLSLNPDLVIDYYNIACAYAIQNDIVHSLENLEKALRKGYRNFEQIQKDNDLSKVRNNPAFKDLIENFMN